MKAAVSGMPSTRSMQPLGKSTSTVSRPSANEDAFNDTVTISSYDNDVTTANIVKFINRQLSPLLTSVIQASGRFIWLAGTVVKIVETQIKFAATWVQLTCSF
jgi:hypothetical protein